MKSEVAVVSILL